MALVEIAALLQRFSRAAGSAGQAGVGWRSIGRSPTAISLKNSGGGDRRGRPILADRAMTVSDDADAVFFRAVARDRHPTPACPASRTLLSYEKRQMAAYVAMIGRRKSRRIITNATKPATSSNPTAFSTR